MTTSSATQADDEGAAELEPVAEDGLEVPHLGDAVAATPPEPDERERGAG